MTKLESGGRTDNAKRASRGSILLVLVGLPLAVFHAGLLLERAMRPETLDAVTALRWVLSVGMLVLLRRMASRPDARNPGTLGVALILIALLIHAPVAATEPALPLAAAGLGLAMSLALFDRRRDGLMHGEHFFRLARLGLTAPKRRPTLPTLKDRAPPAFA